MSETLKKIIPLFKGKKILVIGDLMLDEHIWSKVSRISPEAPVPVAEVNSITHVPGGSGNVALNIATLGGIPYLVSTIGQDSTADKLLRVLKAKKISVKFIIKSKERPTILKSRIIAGSQQVIRVDREDKNEISPKLTKNIENIIKKALSQVDGVIISDYGKGLITETISQTIISLAKKRHIPVAVDPKGEEYKKYARSTVITPNLHEAEVAAKIKAKDKTSLSPIAQVILKKINGSSLLITQGKDGMTLFSQKGKPIYIPAIPREVFDITGAGDTVISTLTLALAAKASLSQAAVLANYAASVVVGKIGTSPILADELIDALEGKSHADKKIKSRKELAQIISNLRSEGYKIVFTNGCFDILHLGHIRYLKEAKKLGDILIVGLNSDKSVKELKGSSRPYVAENERAETLAAVECVDYLTIFSEKRPHDLIKLLRPDFHVKGGDYKIKDLPEAPIVQAYGGKIVIIPKVKDRSTTSLIERIKGAF